MKLNGKDGLGMAYNGAFTCIVSQAHVKMQSDWLILPTSTLIYSEFCSLPSLNIGAT